MASNRSPLLLADYQTLYGNDESQKIVMAYKPELGERYGKENIARFLEDTGCGGIFGGGDAVLGGASDRLQSYGNAVFSANKEKLIRQIAHDVFSALKIGNVNAKTADLDKVVHLLKEKLPNPKKGTHFKDALNKSAENQAKVCLAFVRAINNNYGGVIAEDEDANLACRRVQEVMHTLLTGLQTEFMTMAGDALRTLKNMRDLSAYIDASYKRQSELIANSGDAQLKAQTENVAKFYDKLKLELNRQMSILANMLDGTIGPTGKELISVLEDNKEFAGFVSDLKQDLGTTAFGDKIAYLLSGVSNVAHSAKLIGDALKKLGMTNKDFKAADNLGELRLKILDHIQSKKPNSKELDNMLAAAEIIYKNDYNHTKIAQILDGKAGGCDCGGGKDDEEDDGFNEYDGGANENPDGDENYDELESANNEFKNEPLFVNNRDEMGDMQNFFENGRQQEVFNDETKQMQNIPVNYKPRKNQPQMENLDGLMSTYEDTNPSMRYQPHINKPMPGDNPLHSNTMGGDDNETLGYWNAKSLSKKIANKTKYRELILKDFRKMLKERYDGVILASNEIGPHIGSSIPTSDELKQFIDVFQLIPSLDSETLHIALSGYPKDSTSRQTREQFMNRFHLVRIALEPLTKGPRGELFKNLQKQIDELMESIDRFSDTMVKAITEIHVDRPQDIREEMRKTAIQFFEGGGSIKERRSFKWPDLGRAQNDMLFYFNNAHLGNNLRVVSAETKDFGEGYEQLLGEEAGFLINQFRTDYNNAVDEKLPEKKTGPAPEPHNSVPGTNKSAALQVIDNYCDELKAALGLAAGARTELQTEIIAFAGEALVGNGSEAINAHVEKVRKCLKDNYILMMKREMNAKVQMVEVAQAIDLYLRAFADGIANHPDAVKDISIELDEVEIVAKWFNERNGNTLATVYECFPAGVQSVDRRTGAVDTDGKVTFDFSPNDANVSTDPLNVDGKIALVVNDNQHYYETKRILKPGNPFFGRPLINKGDAKLNGTKRLEALYEVINKSANGVRALDNIISVFSTIGSKYGNLDLNSKTFMSKGQISKALHDYVVVSALTSNFMGTLSAIQVGCYDAADPNIIYSKYLGDEIFDRRAVGNFAQISRADLMETPNVATNVIAKDLTLGDSGIGINNVSYYTGRATGNIPQQVLSGPVDPGQILVNLAPEAGPNSLGARPVLTSVVVGKLNNGGDAVINSSIREEAGISRNGLLSGVRSANTDPDALTMLHKYTSVALASIPDDSRGNFWTYHGYGEAAKQRWNLAGWEDRFYVTDLLYMMVIKSIVCKVFTAIETYRLFNRPVNMSNEHSLIRGSLDPVRTILGGAERSSYPQIIPEAMELYLRLPLLAEWYRDKYNINEKSRLEAHRDGVTDNDWLLTLVPNIDGVWSKFMSLVFDRYEFIKEGHYPESMIQSLIKEINEIYAVYKKRYSHASTKNIINAFVVEINRAMGFLKKQEVDKWIDEKRSSIDTTGVVEDLNARTDYNGYDILGKDDTFTRNAAPSDRFLSVRPINETVRPNRRLVHLQKEILRLRKAMDADMLNFDKTRNYNFLEAFRNYKRELDTAKSNEEKYKIVLRMLQGSNNLTAGANLDKYIMLHEAVIAPLNVLYNVFKVLSRFNALVHSGSLKQIHDFFNTGSINAADPTSPTDVVVNIPEFKRTGLNGLDNARSVFEHIKTIYGAYLRMKYPLAKKPQLQLFVNVSAGLHGSTGPNDANTGYFVCDPGFANPVHPGVNVDSDLSFARNPVNPIPLHVRNYNIKVFIQDLLTALSDLTCHENGLISLDVGSNGYFNLDFSKIEDLCANLLAQVRSNQDKLRVQFNTNAMPNNPDRDLFDKYERVDICGSSRWLSENMFDVLFKDRDKSGLNTALTLINSNFDPAILKMENEGGIAYSANGVAIGSALQKIVYYNKGLVGNMASPVMVNDLTTFPFNILPIKIESDLRTVDQTAILQAIKVRGNLPNAADVDRANALLSAPMIAFETAESNATTATYEHFNENARGLHAFVTCKSIFLTFNKLVKKYLYDNYDDATSKIYTPLFENYMNTAANREVIDSKGFPDIFDFTPAGGVAVHANTRQNYNNFQFGNLSDNSLLFASTSLLMRSFITNVDKLLKKKKHIYESLAEVPQYMKDRMKVNLPFYSKMFNLVYLRADFIRKIVNVSSLKGKIEVTAESTTGLVDGLLRIASVGVAKEGTFQPLQVDAIGREALPNHLITVLNNICEHALSIKKCCDNVYKELQDIVPYFMDLQKDFIADYKNRNGYLPFMPASHLTLPQSCYNGFISDGDRANNFKNSAEIYGPVNQKIMLPTKFINTAAFKFNNATRLILARSDVEVEMDHLPGAKDIYNTYLAASTKTSLISTNEYANTIKLLVQLSRYVNDGAVYSKLFDEDRRLLFVRHSNLVQAGRNALNIVYPNTYFSNSPFCDLSSTVYQSQTCVYRVHEHYYRNIATAGLPGMAHVAAWRPYEFADIVTGLDRRGIAGQGGPDNRVPGLNNQLAVQSYQSYADANEVIASVSKPTKKSSREMFVSYLMQSNTNTLSSRKDMQVANILDLNIVPINVHAFMKEVPFVNILNYSYTFDRMVHEFVVPSYIKNRRYPVGNPDRPDVEAAYGGPVMSDAQGRHQIDPLNTNNIMISAHDSVYTVREFYVKLLTRPFANISSTQVVPSQSSLGRFNARIPFVQPQAMFQENKIFLKGYQYSGLFTSLVLGNDDMKLERPRYLSDQLYNKVLLSCIVTHKNEPMNQPAREIGPMSFHMDNVYEQAGADVANVGGNLVYQNIKIWNATEIPSQLIGLGGARVNELRSMPFLRSNRWVESPVIDRLNAAHNSNDKVVHMKFLHEVGKCRFDTKLIRNLTWFSNLHRLMMKIVGNHLEWISTPVVEGRQIADPVITEYRGNQSFTPNDFSDMSYEDNII